MLELLVVDHRRDVRDEVGLVDHVGERADQDVLAVLLLQNLGAAADRQLAAPQLVHRLDLARAADHRPRREVGPVDEGHEVVDRAVAVVDVVRDAVHEFVEVVRRNVCRHADRDARRAVEQQVGDLGRQHERLGERLVVVGAEIDRLLVEILEHLLGQPVHADFGVAHGGGGVAIDRAEVAVAVDQEIAQREILGHAHDRVVDGLVAMRMVLTNDVAHDARRFLVGPRMEVAQLLHGVQDAAVDRLEPVAGIGERAADDDAHRVVDVGGRHLVLDVDPLHAGRQQLGGHDRLGGGSGIITRGFRSGRVISHSQQPFQLSTNSIRLNKGENQTN